ncbi:hypothetical protein FOXG_20058 [Fusarium oxysporum f. sp. lycopersici 4287]|uniref:PH domain-containing protein n=1 Tax=Fusarium oxysporum f. sp. lycopersici (strain 4287 / CBS 123668 / FGSC 9935 / NRRL 34936) TaxID=426428 RepID=A0A0J9WPB2_FUSO4|nr:hypothetical protein FOXG_20058 [Fusarium oxysporum f. sp. lycopersici 4287]KNB08727.1 hypothetical protein FOXG_20058 [Fusarium oxysporum f. sp. lycopersici 4287]
MAGTLVERAANPVTTSSLDTKLDVSARPRSQSHLEAAFSPVNNDGCFDFDRVLKSGYVQKRTQKTKKWKPVYLVLRPNTLSLYKNESESRLRHQLYLSELTAVAELKDPKHKREHVFGLFSPSRNYHFQANSAEDAQEWMDLIRRDARIDEEEDEMFLASPRASQQPNNGIKPDSSYDSLAVQSPGKLPPAVRPPGQGIRSASQTSVSNVEQDPDRVIWQGRLYLLRHRRGMRQWKDMWAVLRPRNLILYKDESEYTARWILPLSAVVNVVDLDPLSKSKKHCLQVITEEKSYRFCAHDEDALVRCIGAFKSLLAKRRELEARAAATAT